MLRAAVKSVCGTKKNNLAIHS